MFSQLNMTALEQELIALRREFHRYPESGWTEFRTTVRIIEELEKLGGLHENRKTFDEELLKLVLKTGCLRIYRRCFWRNTVC